MQERDDEVVILPLGEIVPREGRPHSLSRSLLSGGRPSAVFRGKYSLKTAEPKT